MCSVIMKTPGSLGEGSGAPAVRRPRLGLLWICTRGPGARRMRTPGRSQEAASAARGRSEPTAGRERLRPARGRAALSALPEDRVCPCPGSAFPGAALTRARCPESAAGQEVRGRGIGLSAREELRSAPEVRPLLLHTQTLRAGAGALAPAGAQRGPRSARLARRCGHVSVSLSPQRPTL